LNLDAIQETVDLFGIIPVIGDSLDALNGVVYLMRGKFFAASLSLAAVFVPFVIGGRSAANVGENVAESAKLAFEEARVIGRIDNVQELSRLAPPNGAVALARYGDGFVWVDRQAQRIGEVVGSTTSLSGPVRFGPNFAKKVRKHIDQVRNRGPVQEAIPSPGRGGIEHVERIIRDRVAEGGGRATTYAGEAAVAFEDGGVTYIFRTNGEFWTILGN